MAAHLDKAVIAVGGLVPVEAGGGFALEEEACSLDETGHRYVIGSAIDF